MLLYSPSKNPSCHWTADDTRRREIDTAMPETEGENPLIYSVGEDEREYTVVNEDWEDRKKYCEIKPSARLVLNLRPIFLYSKSWSGGLPSQHALGGQLKRFSDMNVIALTSSPYSRCQGRKDKLWCHGTWWDTQKPSLYVNNVIFLPCLGY